MMMVMHRLEGREEKEHHHDHHIIIILSLSVGKEQVFFSLVYHLGIQREEEPET